MELFLIIVISFITLVYYGLRGILQPKSSKNRLKRSGGENTGRPPSFLAELFPDQASNDPLAPFFRTEDEVRGTGDDLEWVQSEEHADHDNENDDFFGTGSRTPSRTSQTSQSQAFSPQQRRSGLTTDAQPYSSTDPDPYRTQRQQRNRQSIYKGTATVFDGGFNASTSSPQTKTSKGSPYNKVTETSLRSKPRREPQQPSPSHSSPYNKSASKRGQAASLVRRQLQVSGNRRRAFLRKTIIANELLSKPVSLRDIDPPAGGRM